MSSAGDRSRRGGASVGVVLAVGLLLVVLLVVLLLGALGDLTTTATAATATATTTTTNNNNNNNINNNNVILMYSISNTYSITILDARMKSGIKQGGIKIQSPYAKSEYGTPRCFLTPFSKTPLFVLARTSPERELASASSRELGGLSEPPSGRCSLSRILRAYVIYIYIYIYIYTQSTSRAHPPPHPCFYFGRSDPTRAAVSSRGGSHSFAHLVGGRTPRWPWDRTQA